MQETKNDTQELTDSSFSLEQYKQKQLDIILKNNTVQDDYHTWIRTVDDIKTCFRTVSFYMVLIRGTYPEPKLN